MATGGMPVFGQTEDSHTGGVVMGKSMDPVDVDFDDEEAPAMTKPISLEQEIAVVAVMNPSAMDKLQAVFGIVRSRCSDHVAKMQGWKDFVTLSRPETKEDVKDRVKTNIVRFYANYGLVGSIVIALSIVQSTWCIFMAVLLAAVWCLFIHKTQDAAWDSVAVAGRQLSREQQRTAVAGLSSVVFLFAAGQVILKTVVIFAVVALAHSACHALPAPDGSEEPESRPVHEIGEPDEP